MNNTPRTIIRKIPKNDCYGCEDRKVGCHSTCEKYAAFKKANADDYYSVRHAYLGELLAEKYEIDQKKATLKRQGRKKKYF